MIICVTCCVKSINGVPHMFQIDFYKDCNGLEKFTSCTLSPWLSTELLKCLTIVWKHRCVLQPAYSANAFLNELPV